MSTITTKDGVEIFYKDWGKGQRHSNSFAALITLDLSMRRSIRSDTSWFG